MKTRILRMAQKDDNGVRTWIVPGAPHAVKLLPSHASNWGAPSLKWPALDAAGDWTLRGCRLDWHRSMAKQIARDLCKMARRAKT